MPVEDNARLDAQLELIGGLGRSMEALEKRMGDHVSDINRRLDSIEAQGTHAKGDIHALENSANARFSALGKRVDALEAKLGQNFEANKLAYTVAEAQIAGLQERIAALEARCHELEHQRGILTDWHGDLQERVEALEQQAIRQAAQMMGEPPIDDHRDAERPKEPFRPVGPITSMPVPGNIDASDVRIRDVRKQAPPAVPESKPEAHPIPKLVRCPSYANCTNCTTHRVPHVREAQCNLPCRDGGGICQPVPAQEPEKPAPELVRCEGWEHCNQPTCPGHYNHRQPHRRQLDCYLSCGRSGVVARCCIPVPTEQPIPDVPVSEAFRREMKRHCEELGRAYLFAARWVNGHELDLDTLEHLEHLAGVACVLRDAYDSARIGGQEEADEKLKEISW